MSGEPTRLASGIKQLAECEHPSVESVMGLSNDWLWCSRCGAVREVKDARWVRPALVTLISVTFRAGGR